MCRRVRGVVSAVAAALLLAGCSDGDGSAAGEGIEPIEVEAEDQESEPEPDAGAEAEPAPEPDPGSEPEVDVEEADDPFAFDDPSEIDAAYVDRVMAELLVVESQVLDDVLESDPADGLTQEDGERLRAILSGPRLVEEGRNAQTRATDARVRDAFLPQGERTRLSWQTDTVVGADAGCVIAIGALDNSGVAVEPYPAGEFSVVVLSGGTADQPQGLRAHNPTPWRVHEVTRLIYSDTSEPVPREEWPLLDFEGLLDLPCQGPIP